MQWPAARSTDRKLQNTGEQPLERGAPPVLPRRAGLRPALRVPTTPSRICAKACPRREVKAGQRPAHRLACAFTTPGTSRFLSPLFRTLLTVLFLAGLVEAKEPSNRVLQKQLAAAAALFSNGIPLHIEIQISDADYQALKNDNRKYVRATIIESEKVYTDVGLHLKGAAGSFRQIEEKPAFTLSFNQFNPEQRFHGLRKIHLNNGKEDPTFLREALAAEVFAKARLPVARVVLARTILNGHDLGPYVAIEGFTEEFLGRYF
jgi:hypothetical protein